ncbi:DUF3068 domain-containing protein [Nocardioides panacisoli]|uniref:DUF3068 domain-containing protein n=1 Tax=Nocardioides panacisoli TaxID=627624 RepID=UPI001C62E230|nr:DUF3068 domain-containing protein [Nocardioides panacisoli]QYJ04793.1 DUF3068 domain-containing protein [Nocardioides panacisoli]
MRKIIGPVLAGVGGFLLVAGLVAMIWAPGVVKKTPLDVNTTTNLGGEAAKLDTATGDFDPRPVYAVSLTRVDSDVSTDDTAVWAQTQCVVFGTEGECVSGDDPNLITASISTFATDRVTAEGVATEDLPENTLPADADAVEGLVNKFPFDSEKETYPYWDGTVGAAVDAVYDRTESIDGLETYVYRVTLDEEPIEISEGVPGTYTAVKEIFVEPRTGSIIDQTDDQQRTLADGTPALDLQLSFTDEQVAANVADAEDNISSMGLITTTVPLVGIIGGILLLGVGGLLTVRGRRPASAHVAERPLVNA